LTIIKLKDIHRVGKPDMSVEYVYISISQSNVSPTSS